MTLPASDCALEFRLGDRVGVVHRFPLQRIDETHWRGRPTLSGPRLFVEPEVTVPGLWRASLTDSASMLCAVERSPAGALHVLSFQAVACGLSAETLVPGIAA